MKTQRILSCSTSRCLASLLAVILAAVNLDAATRLVSWGEPGGDWWGSPPPSDLTNLVAIAGNYHRDLALKADGTVIALFPNAWPVPTGLSSVVAIASVGELGSLALKNDGTVVAWGDEGDNLFPQLTVPPDLTNVVAIAGGGSHNLALRSDSTVVAWGDNGMGQLEIPAGLSNIVAIAAGSAFSLALRSDSTVVAWGANHWDQIEIPAGLSNVVAIAAHGYGTTSMALKADGKIVSWGTPHAMDRRLKFVPPSGLTDVVAIAAAHAYNLALRADGTVVAWGDPTFSPDIYRQGVTNVPPSLTNVLAIATAASHNLALVGDGPPLLEALATDPKLGVNGFSVSVASQSGRVYRLEYKESLADTHWIALPLVAGNGGALRLIDSAATRSQRFYRVRRW